MVDLAKIRKKAREKKEQAEPPVPSGPTASEKLSLYRERVREALEAVEQEAIDQTGVDSEETELLTFGIGSEEYAIAAERVVEIVDPRGIARVPNAPPPLSGIMSLRGTIVAVLDVRQRLGQGDRPAGPDSRMVIVRDRGGVAGFVVDRAGRVIRFDPGELEPPPTLSSVEHDDVIQGIIRREGSLLVVLDVERLLG
jgi:purine-binding chemotaxis protein CheW